MVGMPGPSLLALVVMWLAPATGATFVPPRRATGSGVRTTFVLIAEVAAASVEAFDAYEREVLPLLGRHGGLLDRRLRHVRDDGGWLEIHVVSFPDEGGLNAYRGDPDRVRLQELVAGLKLKTTFVDVVDV